MITFLLLFIAQASIAKTKWPSVSGPLVQQIDKLDANLTQQDPKVGMCRFARKDYTSSGFAMPFRSGFYIKGQFGCVYYCGCQNKAFLVTHVFREEHFDANIFSQETGGPMRAKWFICPHAVKHDTWKAYHNEYGEVLGYQVEEDRSYFRPHQQPMSELRQWEAESCQ